MRVTVKEKKKKAHGRVGHAPFMQLSGSGLGRIGAAALRQNGGHPIEFRSLHGKGYILYRNLICGGGDPAQHLHQPAADSAGIGLLPQVEQGEGV